MLTTLVGFTTMLYLWAGRQTFWVVMLADPDPKGCAVGWAVRRGSFPLTVFVAFLLLWPVFMLLGWATARLQKEQAR
jgi:hypothetical protein